MSKTRGVVYLTPGIFDKGGISRYCRYQVEALRELVGDSAVSVLSLLPPDGHGFETPFRVEMASFGANWRGRAIFSLGAMMECAGRRPDIVWCAHVHLAPLALALGRLVGARVVLDVFGYEVWTRLTRVRARSIGQVDCVVADCHATRDYLVDEGLCSPERITVHWDCVDMSRFHPGSADGVLQKYGVPEQPRTITVATLARMAAHEHYKGIDRLIDAMDHIPSEVPVRLVVGGTGSGREALEARAKASSRSDAIWFTGSVSEQDLPDFYRACDIFSLITYKGVGAGEGIPLTPLEAAACGKPALVGNQDGSREAVVHGESGFILEPFDLEGAAKAIVALAQQPELRNSMGQRAHERIEREHSYERFTSRTKEVLGRLGVAVNERPGIDRAVAGGG